MAQLGRAMEMVDLKVEHVGLLAITHAHPDHYGQAATVVERAGCELWMHPAHAHLTKAAEDPEAAIRQRLEIARQSGVPEALLQAYAERRRGQGSGIAGVVLPDRPLLDGVEIASDLGRWIDYETPGHAPSHVCFFQPERRLLISGDHLLGRVSPYFEYGYSPDPVGEFIHSLDIVEAFHARLALSGHGRTFTDVQGHITANRRFVAQRTEKVLDVVTRDGPISAYDAVERVYGEPMTAANASWRMNETLCYLRHLEVTGRAARERDDAATEAWTAA
jgi:glyoxylase-like metal-dependent hydrolase (beta-lactamase superfamily II)